MLSKIDRAYQTIDTFIWKTKKIERTLYPDPKEDEVRKLIVHPGLIPRLYRLKLFLEMVPSSSADVTRALRGCFRGIDVKE